MVHSVKCFSEVHHHHIRLFAFYPSSFQQLQDLSQSQPRAEFSEAILCAAEDVVGFQVVHYLADIDMLHDINFRTSTGHGNSGMVAGRLVHKT